MISRFSFGRPLACLFVGIFLCLLSHLCALKDSTGVEFNFRFMQEFQHAILCLFIGNVFGGKEFSGVLDARGGFYGCDVRVEKHVKIVLDASLCGWQAEGNLFFICRFKNKSDQLWDIFEAARVHFG